MRVAAAFRAPSSSIVPNDAERTRRQRIGDANRGRVPWNKGKSHSETTRRRIAEGTKRAMARPEVRAKILHGRSSREPPSQETRKKIGEGVKAWWKSHRGETTSQDASTRASQSSQEHVTGAWTEEESAILLRGILEHGKRWQKINFETGLNRRNGTALLKRFSVLQRHHEEGILVGELHQLFVEVAKKGHARLADHARYGSDGTDGSESSDASYGQDLGVLSHGPDAWMKAGTSYGMNRFRRSSKFYKSPEHRARISAAIREKWKDPEYRERMAKSETMPTPRKGGGTRRSSKVPYGVDYHSQRVNLERKRAELQSKAQALKEQAERARKQLEDSAGSIDAAEAKDAYLSCEQAQALIDQAIRRIEVALRVSILSEEQAQNSAQIDARQSRSTELTGRVEVYRNGRLVEGQV